MRFIESLPKAPAKRLAHVHAAFQPIFLNAPDSNNSAARNFGNQVEGRIVCRRDATAALDLCSRKAG
jgi:hypothetical protein